MYVKHKFGLVWLLRGLVVSSGILLASQQAAAIAWELGVSYNYKKTTLDDLNNIEQQSTTGSVSMYFWSQVALELSYTNGLYIKRERENAALNSTTVRTTTQFTDVYGADLVFLLADRKAMFQPFLKAGVAYITKRQVVQIGSDASFEIRPNPGWAPSYGAGIRITVSESFSIRGSYDVVRTPIDGGSSANDATGRLGVSWLL